MPAAPSATSPASIGLIGLGLMGSAMAMRLSRAGFEVLGWDRDRKRLDEFVAASHGNAATGEDEISRRCSRIILSLPDSTVVKCVLQNGARPLPTGQIIIDTSTGDPASAEALGAALAKQGVHYLDATVSGSSAQVADGSAVLMVGGDDVAFAKCEDIFTCLGSKTIHAGPAGSGSKLKLITNLVLGLNRAALAEGLSFAKSLGVAGDAALAALQSSMAYSRIMDTKGGKMLRGDFTPQARLSQHLKDVRLMLAASEKALPLTEVHRALLEKAEVLGCGDLDNSAVIKVYE